MSTPIKFSLKLNEDHGGKKKVDYILYKQIIVNLVIM